MVPTLSERLRRRAYECYSPRHICVPWQVSPELPTALLCLAAARVTAEAAPWVSAEAADQVSPEELAKPMALVQSNQALVQSNQPLAESIQPLAEPIQPQLPLMGPRQILHTAAVAGPGEGIAPNPALPQVSPGQVLPSQELLLLLVLSLLTLLDGAQALGNLLIKVASVWRPRQQFSAALPRNSAGLAAQRGIHQPGGSGSVHIGAERIQQRPMFQMFGPALLSRRR